MSMSNLSTRQDLPMTGAETQTRPGNQIRGNRPTWRQHVVYEIYPKSYADGDGDGVGDLAGIRSRLQHIADLGADAIWIAPWYPSPGADGGYDITDYRAIDPVLGTLAQAEALIAEAHSAGLRVITDLVVNHTSHQHPWFTEALAAGAGSPERARYIFRDGAGDSGDLPPNNWFSTFGDCSWTRVSEANGTPGQWYLHTFAPEQPDLDWTNQEVRAEVADILRFWFDRGVDGIRADAVPAMAKAQGLPDTPHDAALGFRPSVWTDAPNWDVDEVHRIMREWRAIADTYEPPRFFIAEAVVSSPQRLSAYLRPDELHAAFNFDFLRAGWDASRLRSAIDVTLDSLRPVGAPATWVLSSHDETRHATRLGRAETQAAIMGFDLDPTSELEVGTRRARAAALLQLALPGLACLYQGDELGLPEVVDLPEEMLQDPIWERSGHTSRGRDGCRVPLPWNGAEPPFGFSPSGTSTWLPQPSDWGVLTVEAQGEDPDSMLNLYRAALKLRRQLPDLGLEDFEWQGAPNGVLAFRRGEGFECIVNLSASVCPLNLDGRRVLLASGPLPDSLLPPNTAAWLRAHDGEDSETIASSGAPLGVPAGSDRSRN